MSRATTGIVFSRDGSEEVLSFVSKWRGVDGRVVKFTSNLHMSSFTLRGKQPFLHIIFPDSGLTVLQSSKNCCFFPAPSHFVPWKVKSRAHVIQRRRRARAVHHAPRTIEARSRSNPIRGGVDGVRASDRRDGGGGDDALADDLALPVADVDVRVGAVDNATARCVVRRGRARAVRVARGAASGEHRHDSRRVRRLAHLVVEMIRKEDRQRVRGDRRDVRSVEGRRGPFVSLCF